MKLSIICLAAAVLAVNCLPARSASAETGLAAPEKMSFNKFGGAEIKNWPAGLTRENVAARYGQPGGVRVVAGGYDVCALDYTHRVLKKSAFHALIRPKYQDLSDQAGWPDIFVEPGWLALDPVSKRVKFSQGSQVDGFKWIGRLDLGGFAATGAVIDGNTVYLCSHEDGSGVLFLDVSDPKAMKVAGNCPILGFPVTAVKNGNLLYVYGSYLLTVVDVSDPAAPRVVNGIHDYWTIGTRKGPMIVLGGQFLAIPHGEYVTVFKLYPDGHLDPVAVWEGLPGGYNSYVLTGTRLILAGGNGVHVLDVADPEKPRIIQATDRHKMSAIHAYNDGLVGLDEKGGIVLGSLSAIGELQVSPPLTGQNVADLDVVGGMVVALTAKRGVPESPALRLYRIKSGVIESNAVCVWKDSDLIGSINHCGGSGELAVSGNRVLVSDCNYGPRLFVLEGEKLVQTSSMMMAGECRGMRIEDDFLHVAKNGLVLIDVFTDPLHPRRVGDVYTRSGEFGLATWADTKRKLVYHATSLRPVPRLISYADPAHPRIINEKPPWHPAGIWKDGLMLGLSGIRGQLVTYEVSDSGEFKEVAALDVPGWKIGGDVALLRVGDLLYVCLGRSAVKQHFSILDISNPRQCQLLGQTTVDVELQAGIGATGVLVDANIAYLGGCVNKGIVVIDCTDPASPRQVAFIDHRDPAFYCRSINCPDEMIVVGDKLILGDYITGLRLFQFTNRKHTQAKYLTDYLSPPEYPYASYMNCSALDYHGRYMYKSNMHDLQVYEISAPSDVPAGAAGFKIVK